MKFFFVLCDDKEIKTYNNDFLKNIFENKFSCVFFWDSIKDNIDNINFLNKYSKSNVPHILCLKDTFFNVRKIANQDLEKFEKYINYLNNRGNGLIVFSQQRLFSLNSTIFTPSLYSFDNLKTIIDLNSNLSIEDVFEPSVFSKNTQNDESLDDFSTGAFDRLLELLAIGQDFVFSIDNEFSKMAQ